jgi:outer membrane receptor protein involved in Fe transport
MSIQSKLSILVAAGIATMPIAGAAELEEVIVTATKRATGLQEIPMSISAISGDSLERNGVADFTDIATSVPAVSFRSSGPGRTKLNIRGISGATGVAPTVSFYIDELPVQTISSSSTTSFAQAIVDPKMYDLERVEVLRGPQGTLYGSSSMGGTIRLITRQPVIGEREGSVAARVSSTEGGGTNYTLNGMFNAPVSDNAALRIVGSYTDNDGYFDRVDRDTGNTFASNVNTEQTLSVRAALRVELGDNSYIQPSVFHQSLEMDGKPNFDGPSSSADGSSDKQFSPFDAAEPYDDDFTMTSLTFGHDFENMTLKAIYSRIDREVSNLEDISDVGGLFGDPNPLTGPAYSDEKVDLEDDTIEVRLVSTTDSDWQWLVGFYRKDAVADAGYRMGPGWDPLDLDGDGDLDSFFNGLANTQKLSDYTEDALFGELTYNINDAWSVTAGLRRLDYDFRSREENWGLAFNGDQGRDQANVRDQVISDSDTQEKLSVAYRFGDGNQVYVSGATGTRPGGVNRVLPVSNDPDDLIPYACQQDLNALGVSDPNEYFGDDVTNTEFGWKLLFRDSSVRFNGAIYSVDWDDIQQLITTSTVCGNNFTANVGSASSTGIELELEAAVSDNLTLFANLGTIDAKFDETVSGATDDIVTKGDKLADVPQLMYNLGFDYVIPRTGGEFYVLGNLNYVDETLELIGKPGDDVSGTGIDSGNVRPNYTTIDMRFGYLSADGWEATMFVENLTDEDAIYGFNDAIAFACTSASCGPGTTADPTVRNRPRTIGVSFQYNFD